MVNTFLICNPLDKDEHGNRGYRISASKLDFKRLNKQTVEAHQILNLVESFYVLGEMFKSPVPKNPYKCHAWVREIMKKYKETDVSILLTFLILFLLSGLMTFFFVALFLAPHPIMAQLIEAILVLFSGGICITCLVIFIRNLMRIMDEEIYDE